MKKRNIIIGLIIILSMSILCYFEYFQKKGYHEDEMYTIVSSNNPIWENGLLDNSKPEWKTKSELEKQVLNIKKFDIATVYDNQVKDVHPPLYYLLVNVFNSIIPSNVFHNGFIINLIFFVLIQFIIIKILNLIDQKKAIIPTLLLMDFSVFMINMITFQRMYTLLTFFCLLYFYYNLKLEKNNFNKDKKIYLGIYISTILGFLSQYFFLIFALVIFIINIRKMLKNKDKINARNYLLVHIFSAVTALIIYPVSIKHVLFGGRGIGTLVNLNFFTKIFGYMNLFKQNIGIPFIIVSILCILFFIQSSKEYRKYFTFPVVFYFVIVSYLAPFIDIRYIMIIIPFVIMIIMMLSTNVLDEKLTIILTILLCLLGFRFGKPVYLYSDYKDIKDISINYSDNNYVYICDGSFVVLKDITSMLNYNNTIAINYKETDLSILKNDEKLNNEFILRMEDWMDKDKILNELKDYGYNVKKQLVKDRLIYEMSGSNEEN